MSQYSSQFRDSRWQKKRLELLDAAGWKCENCGKKENAELQVHHKYYKKGLAPWEYPNETYAVLCDDCHKTKTEISDRYKEAFALFVTQYENAELSLIGFILGSTVECNASYSDNEKKLLTPEEVKAFVSGLLVTRVPLKLMKKSLMVNDEIKSLFKHIKEWVIK